jgi:hypothetical protein
MPTIYETDSLDEAIDIVQDENKVMKKISLVCFSTGFYLSAISIYSP